MRLALASACQSSLGDHQLNDTMFVKNEAIGFFGKVTSYGDFVANRFDAALRRLIDDWLQRSIEHSQRSLGPAWKGAFEAMPVWRFVFAPGLVGQRGFAGLMMPSIDRVGRQFPLMLAARLAAPPSQLHAAENLQLWFNVAERLLLSTRQPGFDLKRFDEALAALPTPPNGDGEVLNARSFWWTPNEEGSRRFSTAGLPAPDEFVRFLGGARASPKATPQRPPLPRNLRRPFEDASVRHVFVKANPAQ